MEREDKTTSKVQEAQREKDLIDYKTIVEPSKTTVIIESEWTKAGDFFKKFTMYDDNYTPIPSLGETTLI